MGVLLLAETTFLLSVRADTCCTESAQVQAVVNLAIEDDRLRRFPHISLRDVQDMHHPLQPCIRKIRHAADMICGQGKLNLLVSTTMQWDDLI
jgi:hypothetical protein